MAGRDDAWKRFREREDEKEKESEGTVTTEIRINSESTNLSRRFEEALLLIERVNSLYNQYFSGAETRPPVEVRRQLERLMLALLQEPKPTQAMNFKWGSLNSSYLTHKDKWDRQLRALESGKIARPNRKKLG